MSTNNIQSTSSENNKRIAKNTLFMYLRMLVQMAVAFYTVRVIFNVLGTDNYGIFNVVGGVIVFFTFINSGLTSATRRYVTSEIVKGTVESGRHVFNTCVIAHLLIALIVLILSESIGVWVINHVLNIPTNRLVAANWVFQFSVLSAIIGIMQAPFDATIVAYEKMSIYAYFSILDVILKLAIVFILKVVPGDKLIIYSILLTGTFVITILVNRIYCYRTFPICRWKYKKDTPLLKEIFRFMSWSLLGQAAVVGTNQGVSMLINVYFNVAVNAAIGVSNQIISNVNKFVGNFQVAFNPQIIKSYTTHDFDYLITLMIRASKISSFLIIIFLVPLFFETGNVLTVWLGHYPEYAVEFCLLTFVAIYLEAVGAPLWMLQYAKSDIRNYQLVVSSVFGLIFPLSWLLLLMPGVPPYSVVYVRITIFVALLGVRLWYAHKVLPVLNIVLWLKEILGKGLIIIVLAGCMTGAVSRYLTASPLYHILTITVVSLCCTLPLIYRVGLNNSERSFCKTIVRKRIFRR